MKYLIWFFDGGYSRQINENRQNLRVTKHDKTYLCQKLKLKRKLIRKWINKIKLMIQLLNVISLL